MAARKSAALRVSPGGFDVSMRTYSCSRRVVSSCCCPKSFTTVDTAKTHTTEDTAINKEIIDLATKNCRGLPVTSRDLRGRAVSFLIQLRTHPSLCSCAPDPT